MTSDLPDRILCSDGTCIGIVNEEGICNICGAALGQADRSKDQEQNWHGKRDPSLTKNAIIGGLVITAISSFALKLLLFFYYMGKSPQAPNMASGQIYPLNNHGYIFYVTRGQNFSQDILFYVFLFLIGLIIILGAKWDLFENLRRRPY